MSKEHDHDHSHGHAHDHQCCGHDHAHGHQHEGAVHDHTHEHKHECCGHEHEHTHAHEHAHSCCGHDHDHNHKHAHAHGCCGHDHGDAEWTRRFFAFLQGVVLLMIGIVMVYFVVTSRINHYVTGWFRGLALAGGIGLIVLGLFNWVTSRRQVDCGHDHDHAPGGDDDGEDSAPHVHSHDGSPAGRALTLLVLSGTVAAASMFTPDGFSRTYAMNKGSAYAGDANSAEMFKKHNPQIAASTAATPQGGFTLAKVEEYIKRTKEGNFPLSVVNLHYMGADQEYATVMDGQPVETVGQVVKDELNPGPKNLRIFTMQVTCCAADARPYSVPIIFDDKVADYVEMGWYKVTGKLEFTQERGMKMARLKVAKPGDMQATIRPDPDRPSY